MALMQIELTNPDFGFKATDAQGHELAIDIPVDQGGHGDGFRPMQILLAGLGGCSGVDVISILKKQRQALKALRIKVDGEREQGKEPALWKTLRVRFELEGSIDPVKAWRAVELSMDKYCSVAETLRRAGAELQWSVSVDGVDVEP